MPDCDCTTCRLARIEHQLTNQGELLMSINDDLQAVTTQLDKVYTEVTSVNDDLKAQIARRGRSTASRQPATR